MIRTRRRFLEHVVTGAALSTAAPSMASANAAQAPPGPGRYDYLGRTPGYRDWAVVPRGLTVKSIETFRRDSLALVRITASDGKIGWGQAMAEIFTRRLKQLQTDCPSGKNISHDWAAALP